METALSPQIFTVSGLSYKIKHELRSLFPQIQVKGEISNLKKQASGHVYFTLKDSAAQLSCALFRGAAVGLDLPKEGDQVVASGQIDVYPPRGSYQLIVTSLKKEGIGDLLLQLEELKGRLRALGWFEKCRPLPPFPKRIGIITSPTGAVIRDICHVLKRRSKGFDLLLYPVAVQGEACPKEVAEAIAFFNTFRNVDVLIVARGGGSIEDLWGFNSEIVTKAIYESAIPVISAIGHETDTTLADLAADLRAPTPSAAAEIVMRESSALVEKLATYRLALRGQLLQKIERRQIALKRFTTHPLMTNPERLLSDFFQRCDSVIEEFARRSRRLIENRRQQIAGCRRELSALKPAAQVLYIRQKLKKAAYTLRRGPGYVLAGKSENLKNIEKHLKQGLKVKASVCEAHSQRLLSLEEQLLSVIQAHLERRRLALCARREQLIDRDPRAILKKGYAIVFSQNKESIILSSKDLQGQKRAWVRHSDGETEVEIR